MRCAALGHLAHACAGDHSLAHPSASDRRAGQAVAFTVMSFTADPRRPARRPRQGTDEAEEGLTYSAYEARQIRALHPVIQPHPGAVVVCGVVVCWGGWVGLRGRGGG